MKNYPAKLNGLSANIKALRANIGPTMQGFSAMAQAAIRPRALEKKTKEIIAFAIGVATTATAVLAFIPRRS